MSGHSMKKVSKSPKPKAPKTSRAASVSSPVPTADGDEMRPEYDFSGGVRGKYAARFAVGRPVRVVVLAPDVAEGFRSARAVNAALRRLLKKRERPGGARGRSRRTASYE